MKYQLHQFVTDDTKRDFAFRRYDPDRPVAPANYGLTWEGRIDAETDAQALEALFRKFNIDHPAGFESYSMSLGDVVVLNGQAYYCDTIGFKLIEGWA